MPGQRMFVALTLPEEVVEELADFLEPRSASATPGGMPWVDPAQWHVTLAFMPSVPAAREDELVERLHTLAARHEPFDVRLAGGGCFPDPIAAKVLWLGVSDRSGLDVHTGPETLAALARGARAAANASGAAPDGQPFVPHLTLARLRRPVEATRWLRVLDAFTGAVWSVDDLVLVASHLGKGPAGRPRYEEVARVPLGG